MTTDSCAQSSSGLLDPQRLESTEVKAYCLQEVQATASTSSPQACCATMATIKITDKDPGLPDPLLQALVIDKLDSEN